MIPQRLGVVVRQGVAQGFGSPRLLAQPGLEDAPGCLARAKARDADLPGDLAEGGVDGLLELLLIHLDRQLDLVALERLDHRFHSDPDFIEATESRDVWARGGRFGTPRWVATGRADRRGRPCHAGGGRSALTLSGRRPVHGAPSSTSTTAPVATPVGPGRAVSRWSTARSPGSRQRSPAQSPPRGGGPAGAQVEGRNPQGRRRLLWPGLWWQRNDLGSQLRTPQRMCWRHPPWRVMRGEGAVPSIRRAAEGTPRPLYILESSGE